MKRCERCGEELVRRPKEYDRDWTIRRFCSQRCASQRPLAERFWQKVRITDACWVWTGATSPDGYGHLKADQSRRDLWAHRVAYEMMVGPIPDGLQIDHLCRNPSCVNPAHLEPVTGQVNVRRGIGHAAVNAAKTHCCRGHPFDSENTYYRPGGSRRCRACECIHAKKRYDFNLTTSRQYVREQARKRKLRLTGKPVCPRIN